MPCGVVLSSSGLVSTRSNRITAVPYLSPCRHAAIATFTGYPSTAAPLHGTGYSPTTRPALSDLTGFRSTASTSVIVIVPSEACYAAYLSPARMGPRTSAGYVCRWRFPGAPAPYVTRQVAFEGIHCMPLCYHDNFNLQNSSPTPALVSFAYTRPCCATITTNLAGSAWSCLKTDCFGDTRSYTVSQRACANYSPPATVNGAANAPH